ncbi:MAG: hypothetical protein M1536_02160, partial [Firmicutes bacterium]|nr:hypothetical protein [Bacillota bacterium]
MILYLKESAKSIGSNIKEVSEPLEALIQDMEELFEGEEFEEEETEEEAEEINEEDLKEISEEEEDTEIKADLEATREDLEGDKEKLNASLKARLGDAGVSDVVSGNLATLMSEIYLECVQYAREIGRLGSAADGDLASILSVMIDLQYGIDLRMRDLILEDLYVDNERNYAPGILTWISHFVHEIMEMINAEEVMALKM